jgi:hypothetical protein
MLEEEISRRNELLSGSTPSSSYMVCMLVGRDSGYPTLLPGSGLDMRSVGAYCQQDKYSGYVGT